MPLLPSPSPPPIFFSLPFVWYIRTLYFSSTWKNCEGPKMMKERRDQFLSWSIRFWGSGEKKKKKIKKKHISCQIAIFREGDCQIARKWEFWKLQKFKSASARWGSVALKPFSFQMWKKNFLLLKHGGVSSFALCDVWPTISPFFCSACVNHLCGARTIPYNTWYKNGWRKYSRSSIYGS